jgi:predicted nucleic acid-binding protein
VILVDTIVWIDLIERDSVWLEWSLAQVMRARVGQAVAINPVIYAELAPTYDEPQTLAQFVRLSGAQWMPLSAQAAWAASRAFLSYRQRRGAKTGVLPDFFIGGQAQAEGWTLLTRDAARYRTYFPSVALICPETTR